MVENGMNNNTNEVTLDDMKKCGCHIPSFNGKNIAYCQENKKDLRIKYNGNIDFSLDLIHLFEVAKSNAFWAEIKISSKNKNKADSDTEDEIKVFTNIICNVTFDKPYQHFSEEDFSYTYNTKKRKIKKRNKATYTIKSVDELRNQLYKDGFSVKYDNQNIDYVYYCRSSSKARSGSDFFIRKDLLDFMRQWELMGLQIAENMEIDLASLLAYQSLTLSGIKDILKIDPKSILLINDFEGEYVSPASVTRLVDGMPVVTNEKEFKHKFNAWDGQSLIDVSILPEDCKEDCKGMYQLRNRYFKTAAFACRLQDYFSDRCKQDGRDYNTAKTKDMFGNEMYFKDIRLVTTPSSLKYLKFAQYVQGDVSKKSAYKYWIDHVSQDFGLVKNEKSSIFADGRALSYQMLNSLDLSENDILTLLQDEIDFIKLLNTEPAVFRWFCGLYKPSPTSNFVANMIATCPSFEKTDEYVKYRSDRIRRYKEKLLTGKIKIKNCDYAVMVGCPDAMMQAAYGDKFVQSAFENPYDVWCKKFKDGEMLAGFRNPHVCTGNTLYATNTWHDEFKYFVLTDNICIINTINSDIQDRLSGSDQDSDTVLLTNNTILVAKAKEAQKYWIPVKDAKLPLTLRPYNNEQCAIIDDIISNNRIGQIIDLSQIVNSYIWDYKHKGASPETLNNLYDMTSCLSSLSQFEIDKAKKFYDEETVKIKEKLGETRASDLLQRVKVPYGKRDKIKISADDFSKIKTWKEAHHNGEMSKGDLNKSIGSTIDTAKKASKTVSQIVKPLFFKHLPRKGDEQEDVYQSFDCPMDYLCELITGETKADKKVKSIKKLISAPRRKPDEKISMSELVVSFKDNKDNRRQIKELLVLVHNAKQDMAALWDQKDLEAEKRYEKRLEILADLAEDFKDKKNVSIETINRIIWLCTQSKKPLKCDEGIELYPSQYLYTMLSTLWKAYPDKVLSCFELCGDYVPQLVKSPDGNIDLWGDRYLIQ